MIQAYINYPNPHISIHHDPNCPSIRTQAKENQRVIKVNAATISEVLSKFQNHDYRFASTSALNDMWLIIDFGDGAFEEAVPEYIRRHLANRYTPFRQVKPEFHCQK